jgi:mono/diheme cytochrome c family protein
LREIADGYIFDVITNGIRTMPSYSDQVRVEDRWAIIAYIRALQRSQNAGINDVPEELRNRIR